MEGYYNILESLEGVAVDWIHLAQYRVQWRTLANTVMNVRVL